MLYVHSKEARRFTEKLSSIKFITLNFSFTDLHSKQHKTSERKVYINRIERRTKIKQTEENKAIFYIFKENNSEQVKNDISQALYLFNISYWITAGGDYCPVSLASRCARSTDIVFMCL